MVGLSEKAAVLRSVVSAVLFLMLFSSCAGKTTVVLLAEEKGKVGRLNVRTEAGKIEIDQHGEATTVLDRNRAPSKPKMLSEEEIAALFGEVLAMLPDKPATFILYFYFNSTELTAESARLLPDISAVIERRQSESISVVGHTDTLGNRNYNFDLSKRRAQAVSRLLSEQGVSQEHLTITSHGENNLLIKTGDGVLEPRNRRVEVIVR